MPSFDRVHSGALYPAVPKNVYVPLLHPADHREIAQIMPMPLGRVDAKQSRIIFSTWIAAHRLGVSHRYTEGRITSDTLRSRGERLWRAGVIHALAREQVLGLDWIAIFSPEAASSRNRKPATKTITLADGESVSIRKLTQRDVETLRRDYASLSEVKQRDGYSYRVLTVQFRARGDGWDQKYESRGLFELSGGSLRPIANPDGTPVESPWPLNASGAKLATAGATGAEIVLKPYARTSLASLVA